MMSKKHADFSSHLRYISSHSFLLSPSHPPAIYPSIHHPPMQPLTHPNSGPSTSPVAGGTGMKNTHSHPQGAHRVNSKKCTRLIFTIINYESGRSFPLLLLSLLGSTVLLPKGIMGNKVCPKGQPLLEILAKGIAQDSAFQ